MYYVVPCVLSGWYTGRGTGKCTTVHRTVVSLKYWEIDSSYFVPIPCPLYFPTTCGLQFFFFFKLENLYGCLPHPHPPPQICTTKLLTTTTVLLLYRGGSFSQKIEPANPAQLSGATPGTVFHTALWNQLRVSRLCTPTYRGMRVHDSRLRPNQTLVSFTLAGLA